MSKNIYSRTLGQLVKDRLEKSTERSDRDLRKYVVPVFYRKGREKSTSGQSRYRPRYEASTSRTQGRCVMAWPNLRDKHDT